MRLAWIAAALALAASPASAADVASPLTRQSVDRLAGCAPAAAGFLESIDAAALLVAAEGANHDGPPRTPLVAIVGQMAGSDPEAMAGFRRTLRKCRMTPEAYAAAVDRATAVVVMAEAAATDEGVASLQFAELLARSAMFGALETPEERAQARVTLATLTLALAVSDEELAFAETLFAMFGQSSDETAPGN